MLWAAAAASLLATSMLARLAGGTLQHQSTGPVSALWDGLPAAVSIDTPSPSLSQLGTSPDGERLYAVREGIDGNKVVAAFGAADGSEIWTSAGAFPGTAYGLAVASDDSIVALYASGTGVLVAALDGRTGTPLWQQPLVAGSDATATPAALTVDSRAGRIALMWKTPTAAATHVAVLDLPSGQSLWSARVASTALDGAALAFSPDGVRLFVLAPSEHEGSSAFTVSAFEATTAAPLWVQTWVNGYDEGGTLVALGEARARALAIGPQGSTIVVTGSAQGVCDQDVLPTAGGGQLLAVAYDAETGALRWVHRSSAGPDACLDEHKEGLDVTVSSTEALITGTTGATQGTGADQFVIALDLASGILLWEQSLWPAAEGLSHARVLFTGNGESAVVLGGGRVEASTCGAGEYAVAAGLSTVDGTIGWSDVWAPECETGGRYADATLSKGDAVLFALAALPSSGRSALTALSLSGSETPQALTASTVSPLAFDAVPSKISAAIDPRELTNINGVLFFSADDGVHGREIWKSDGTPAGTMMVKDIRPGAGASFPLNFTAFEGLVFFTANDGFNGAELWKTDGTPAGTVLVRDIEPGSGSGVPTELTVLDGKLLFGATTAVHGRELWISDGTEGGTQIVRDIRTGTTGSNVAFLLAIDGAVLFRADDGAHGGELWRSDGTPGGTTMVKDVRPGSLGSFLSRLTNVGGIAFFSAADDLHGIELWKSDGTESGTLMVKDIRPGGSSSDPSLLTVMSGTLYFVATDGFIAPGTGLETWKSDGTEAGTVVLDVNPGPGSTSPRLLTAVHDTLYFVANSALGTELMKTDGTVAGTALVKDIFPGSITSDPRWLTRVGDLLFFVARHQSNDFELWKSDGTEAGTVQVLDIFPGTTGSTPQWLTNANGRLFFSAEDGMGRALWAMHVADETSEPPDPPEPPAGPLRVRCLHEPLLPQNGEPITITAEARAAEILDIATEPVQADEIEIWAIDRDGPKAIGSNMETLQHTTTAVGLPPSFMMAYACRVRIGDEIVFSGWRQTSTIERDGAVPVIYTGPTSERLDIIFFPDQGSYTGVRDPQFLQDAFEMIRDGYYDFPLYGGLGSTIGDRFNFWIGSHMADIVPDDQNECGTLKRPDTWARNYAFGDTGAILHWRAGFRDCAMRGLFSTRMDRDDPVFVLRHETGHRPFRLADEYCREEDGEIICDGGYFQTRMVPNIYRTLKRCEEDAADLRRLPQDCRSFESSHFLGRTWFTSEPDNDDLMNDNRTPQAADIRRILWMYARCAEGKC